jgi:5'-nucleotidase/UDP-sugar diphosphatase
MRSLLLPALALVTACGPRTQSNDVPALAGMDVRLTILHTSDIHSRLLEYEFDPSFTDNTLGLADDYGPYGGIAEMAYILKRERAKAGRVLHLDSGDCFQGAIIFNQFQGEAEVRTLGATGLDAAVIANHEFDAGAQNLADQMAAWASYDLLAANYDFEAATEPWATALEEISLPSALYSLDGLNVGVIGLANLSSLNSIYNEDNSMGITVIDERRAIADEAAKLRAQGADIIVAVSHMGLDDDLELAEDMDEVDIFIGGHHHVAIDPPLVVTNKHSGKRIPVVHSGAFAKFVGRADFVIRDGQVLSHSYQLFPVDRTVPQDPEVLEILEEYQEQLDYDFNTDQVIGYANTMLTRYGSTGGDSMLGNFTAESMRAYPGVETEVAITNTLGIRSDIGEGEITLDDLYNSMPFDNTITTMYLSGREIQEVLDFATSRSTDRGCQSQIQVAGIRFTMDCRQAVATDIVINGVPLDQDGTYEIATNNYIAHGGSGFSMLERNTTQNDTGVSIRDVVRAAITNIYLSSSGDGSDVVGLPQPGIAEEDGRIQAVF